VPGVAAALANAHATEFRGAPAVPFLAVSVRGRPERAPTAPDGGVGPAAGRSPLPGRSFGSWGEGSSMRRKAPGGRSLAFVVAATALATMSHYMAMPLVPLAAAHVGAGTAGVGLATGVFALLPLLLAVPVGLLADRAGAGRVALGGVLLMGLTTLALLAPTLDGLVAAQALRGLGQVALMIGMQGLVAMLVPRDAGRETAYGSFVLGVGAGQLAGPAVGGWLADRAGLSAAFLASAALALAGAAVGLRPALDEAPPAAAIPSGSPGAPPLRTFALLGEPAVRAAVVASSLVMLTQSIATSFYPLLLQRGGVSVAAIGMLLALRGGAICLARPLLPPLLRRAGRWSLVRWSIWFASLSTVATPFSLNPLALGAEAVAGGLATGVGPAITMAVVADAAGEARRSEALALRIGLNRLLQFAGPVGLGVVGGHWGLPSTFLAGGLLTLVALFSLWGLGGRPETVRGRQA
jgi:predicted MFS family arabinose efflux permease